MAPPFWTPERMAALELHWGEGRSHGAIARLLAAAGEPCTKSMVKSKSVRMELPDRIADHPRVDRAVLPRAEPAALPEPPDERGCRWPDGDPGDKERFRFCGGPPLMGKPYCARHAARAYLPAKAGGKERAEAA